MSQKSPTIQLTEAGFAKLQKELDELEKNKRPAAVDRLSQARSMGDLSENSDYHQAKEQLEFIDGRIVELESVLNQAVIVKSGHSKKEVEVGAQVKVSIKGSQHTFNIVGEWEADPKEKKISHESPLGKAFAYTINHWTGLILFLEDGRLEIDNNHTEREIKPFVIARKGFLFADSVGGAHALAMHFSILRSAIANKLEQYRYYVHILKNIPHCKTVEDYEKLLPWNITFDGEEK